MAKVLLCLCPGIAVSLWFFGIGVILNIILSVIAALAFESLCAKLRGKKISECISDYSALVTATLFAVSIPIGVPWWIIFLGMGFAIILVKHAFGGLGQNVFNPAMSGYLFLLISYPLIMTSWNVPNIHFINGEPISPLSFDGFSQSVAAVFSLAGIMGSDNSALIDGMTMATPLVEYKLSAPNAIAATLAENENLLHRGSGTGWELVSIAYLLGGIALLLLRVIRWHIPAAILATLGLLSLVFYSSGSASVQGTPYLHLFGGATILGAFFIATDPVSAATSNGGRIAYGVLIGLCIYLIRVWGSYLDGVAIAIIFANFWAPLFDSLFRPTVYGSPTILSRLRLVLRENFK